MDRQTLRAAFIKSIPVMAGYVVLGIGFGILLRESGYGLGWALAMSLFIYAGSLQYVGVSMLAAGASLLTGLLTSIMVNARHLFYSISMIGRYRDAGVYKPYMIFGLTDEVYTLLVDGDVPEGSDPQLYRFLVTLFCHSYWVSGSVLGSALGTVLPFSTEGIEFSMTALFIAAFTGQWMETRDHFPALTGLLSTLLCRVVFGPGRFLIPAMLLITAVLTLSDHAARQSGSARRKPGTGFSDAITGAWARGTGTGVKKTLSSVFFTLSRGRMERKAEAEGTEGGSPGEGSPVEKEEGVR